MAKYHTVLFDLDGTLVDTGEGIFRCLGYAMEKMGLPPITRADFRPYVGPPLETSFQTRLGLSPEDSVKATAFFRERYERQGFQEVTVVEGMAEALKALKDAGITLAVASSKPLTGCHRVLGHTGLAPYFDVVSGHAPHLANNKEAVIREALRLLHITDPKGVLMVGDREYDALGAAACSIPCLGVDFCGFAHPGEMEAAGAFQVVTDCKAMTDVILGP